jgi:DNA-binding IscR family transcriptional regulator
LIKSFLDNIILGREVERIHAQEVLRVIEGELAGGAFSEVEKQLLEAELNRARKSMNT